MQDANPLSDQDLRKVFGYLNSWDELFLVELKGINPWKVNLERHKTLLRSLRTKNILSIASLIESDTETEILLLQSQYAKKLLKLIENRRRIGDQVLHKRAVTRVDTGRGG